MQGGIAKTETRKTGKSVEERDYFLSFKEYGMKDEVTYVKPFIREKENYYPSEGTREEMFFSKKGQLLDQGKTYKNHDLFHWTFGMRMGKNERKVNSFLLKKRL